MSSQPNLKKVFSTNGCIFGTHVTKACSVRAQLKEEESLCEYCYMCPTLGHYNLELLRLRNHKLRKVQKK
jgi:hypothetical protein